MVLQWERPRVVIGNRPTAVDQERTPLLAALDNYQSTVVAPFSAPGHKRGAGTGAEVQALLGAEVFAADVWLGVADHDPAQRAAEDLAAAAWGADRSCFLVNGSSSGTQAFLLAHLAPGDEVVVARDAHQSVLTALILTGARPVWVSPRVHPAFDVSLGIAAADVEAALAAHPMAKLVVLTSPTYHGVASDVAAIVAVAHGRGVPVYVDEAWGAHFPFHPALPPSAMASGADGAVTSAHKLLATLRQGALLHLRGSLIDQDRIASAVRMTQTTSPSMPILASLDACRRQMATAGEALLNRAIGLASGARRRLRALRGLSVLDGCQLGEVAFDPTRLVVDVRGLGWTGLEAERELRQRSGVAPAMADLTGVVCVVGLGDTHESLDRLVAAFTMLASRDRWLPAPPAAPGLRSVGAIIAPGHTVCSPREAFLGATRTVPVTAAAGEVAAEPVIPYPPGIPLVVPGEVISAEVIAYLRAGISHGLRVRGPADPTLATLRVLECPLHLDSRDRGAQSVDDRASSIPTR